MLVDDLMHVFAEVRLVGETEHARELGAELVVRLERDGYANLVGSRLERAELSRREQNTDVVGDDDDGSIAAGGLDSQEKIGERVVRPHLDPSRSTLTHAAW